MVKYNSGNHASKCQQLQRRRVVARSEAVSLSTKPWEEWEALWHSSAPEAEETCMGMNSAFSVAPMSFTLRSADLSALVSQKVKLCLYGFRHSLCRCSPFPVREGSFMLYQSSQRPLGIHLDEFCFFGWLKALSESSRLKKAPHTPACFAEVTCGLKEL